MREVRQVWAQMVREKASVAAFADVLNKDGKPELAGVNVCGVKEAKDHYDVEVKTNSSCYYTLGY